MTAQNAPATNPLEQTEAPAPSLLSESSDTAGELAAASASQRLIDPDHPSRFVFVPSHLAAVCGDCQGVFNVELGHCPGCASQHWVLLYPERVALAAAGGGS